MPKITARTVLLSIPLVAVLFVFVSDPSAFSLEIKDDKLSVRAVRVPLQDVLKRLSSHGIGVRIDPDINPLVSARFDHRNLEDGLKALLRPQNHVFIWRREMRPTENGTVSTVRLDEIHVFRPGLKGRMISFDPADAGRPAPVLPGSTLPDTKVIIQGNRVLVPATIGYQGQTVEATLIFDTGAGSIVLHENIAEALGIDDTRASRGVGVGGIEIASRTTRLEFVQVGPHRKENLRADIVAYRGEAEAPYNGLLGMNFLRGLKYTIDFNAQLIRWGQ